LFSLWYNLYRKFMTIAVSKIYSELFGEGGAKDWEVFRSKGAELVEPKEVDFSITGPEEGVARKVGEAALKVVLLPWGLYCGMRWLVQRLIMIKVYPVQSSIVKFLFSELKLEALDAQRSKAAAELAKKGFIVRHLWIESKGTKLSALMAIHPDHAQNGKWVLQACGNFQPIEYGLELVAKHYHKKNYNVLIVNNPGVGRSEGTSTPETMGEAQEAGIAFLETAVKPRKIVLAGYSLGGGALGQAILKHDFKKGIKYVVIRQMSFGTISQVCEERYREIINVEFLRRYIRPVVEWAGCEIDSVAVSRELQKRNIQETVIQRVNDNSEFDFDGAIPKEASLAFHLHREGILDLKQFIRLPNIDHLDGDEIASATVQAIHDWENQFRSLGTRIIRYLRSCF
jgi:hypothetical protein